MAHAVIRAHTETTSHAGGVRGEAPPWLQDHAAHFGADADGPRRPSTVHHVPLVEVEVGHVIDDHAVGVVNLKGALVEYRGREGVEIIISTPRNTQLTKSTQIDGTAKGERERAVSPVRYL